MITVWKGQSANRKLNFNLFIIKVTLLIIDFTLRPGFISQLPHCPAPRPHRPLPSAPAHSPNGAHGAVGMHGAPPGLPVPEDGVQVTCTQRPPAAPRGARRGTRHHKKLSPPFVASQEHPGHCHHTGTPRVTQPLTPHKRTILLSRCLINCNYFHMTPSIRAAPVMRQQFRCEMLKQGM